MRTLLNRGRREDFALWLLLAGCLMIFIGQLPYQARLAHEGAAEPLRALVLYSAFGWMLVVPVVAYVVALVIFLALRLFTAKSDAYHIRLALFWTLLALAPANLFYGLCRGFLGDTGGTMIAGAVLVAGFFWILVQSVRETLSDV